MRPWVILEVYTAITHDVPIVALNVNNANPYDYGSAMDFLLHFDKEIEIANPGAAELLMKAGVDPVDVAWRLSDSLPNIISTDFNPNSSSRAIVASLEDLVDSMRRAAPMAPTKSKEKWLEERATPPEKVSNHERKQNGKGGGEQEAPGSADARVSPETLAKIPATVPELPNAYLVRMDDLQQLKVALLAKDGSSSAALTSKKGAQSKVGAHGMGGVGKTTIAASLVHDKEIRRGFQTIVWVSVGKEPDLTELQNSIHFQLTMKKLPEEADDAAGALGALRVAAKGLNVLLVLDDVWEPQHEKPLNCIDPDSASRLLVTTRIRGLLKNSAEVDVGVLSQNDALSLLLSSADVNAEDVQEGSDDHRFALEIVELCGALPLALAIAGGMVADNGQTFSEDIVDDLKESHDLEDEEGLALEDRVISSSVKMMVKGAGKNKELVHKVFLFFAVFPEDVPVPASFFNKMAPLLTNEKSEKKARLAMGLSLGILLKYNLIKGSLMAGQGVFMHDIVRDFVINQHSEADLRALQKEVVGTILAARPEPDGFSTTEHAAPGTFEGYVARQFYVHIRGALEKGKGPPDLWLAHADVIVKVNTAVAVGLDALAALSEARESTGELVRAAHASWAASRMKGIPGSVLNDLVHRSADLLERADDKEAVTFEQEVLSVAWLTDSGSERANKCTARQKLLAATTERTFASATGEAMASFVDACTKLGYFGGEEGPAIDALPSARSHAHILLEAVELSPHKSIHNLITNMWAGHVMGMFLPMSPFEEWCNFGCSEENMVEGMNYYKFDVCGRVLKDDFIKLDMFMFSTWMLPLALLFGNLSALDSWHKKAIEAWNKIDLPGTNNYAAMVYETYFTSLACQVPLHIMLGQGREASEVLKALGFTWDEGGFDRFETLHTALKAAWPPADLECDSAMCRLFIFLSFPKSDIDKVGVDAWIPSPAKLAEMERGYCFVRRWGLFDLTSYGARAFLKLGRDDDAYELARLAVAPEQKTEKKTTLVACNSILGQVAAKRGHLDEADGHFTRALEEAKLSRLPMLEVLAAREWKQHMLQPAGRDCAVAEAVIDAACTAMNKDRDQMTSHLGSIALSWCPS